MKKKVILNTGLLAVLSSPIAMAISCSEVAPSINIDGLTADTITGEDFNGIIPDQDAMGGNPFEGPVTTSGNSFDWSQNTTDGILASSAFTLENTPPEFWGYDTQAVTRDFGIYYGTGYVDRLTTGRPKARTWAYYFEPWAWSPKIVTGTDPVTHEMPGEYDPDLYDQEKLEGNVSQLRAATASEVQANDPVWYNEATAITGVDFPTFENSFGAHVDDEFNRPTITEPRTVMYGEKLKPTQSTYTPLTAYMQLRALNANYNIGMTENMTSTDNQVTFASWQYLTEWVNWRGFPSQDLIDVSHRAGVGTTGLLWIARNDYAHAKGMMLNPGPDGNYPYAQGLVDIADYYGFDGWVINWEESDSNDVSEFHKKLVEYANAPSNYTPTLDSTDKNYVDTRTDFQKEYGYYHRKQTISIYTGTHSNRRTAYSGQVNRHDNVQTHGGDANVSTHTNWIDEAYNWGHDAYFPNAAYSPGEKGLTNGRAIAGQHYNASQETYKDKFPTSEYANYDVADKSTYLENRMGLWIYIYGSGDDIAEDTRHFSSFSGDPRIIDDQANWAMSNSWQEKTTIIGDRPWATTFDYGSGLEWSFMGSDNLVASVYGADTDSGWKNHEQQSSLPTYKWIIDEYDANGNIMNDPNQDGGLTVDGNGQVVRKTTVNLDNTATAYHGGTVLQYGGELLKDEMIDNKLYAAALHVNDGDTFTIKYSKEAYDAGQVDLNLAAWSIQGHMKLPESDVSGTPENNDWIAETDDMGQALEDRQGGQYWEYQKEEYWDTNSVKKVVEPSKVETVGETNWVEATYDLSGLDGRTIRAFGTNIVAKDDTNLSNLKLGQMKFNPQHYNVEQFTISNPNISGIWGTDNGKTQALRINWEDDAPDYDVPNKIRHYYTFYADSDWNPTSLAWVGGHQAAYLRDISSSNTSQNIIIVGLDEQYNVAAQKSISLNWGGQDEGGE